MDNRKVKFDSNFILDFGASNQTRIYGFLYEIFENDILKNQIFYEVEVVFLTDQYGNNSVFEINRKQIFINNKKSRSHLEQIADDAGQAIFPIRIKIKKNGEIEKILNQDAIVHRWKETKIKLLDYYKGEKITKVITKIETVFFNDNLLEKSLKQNWFFNLFFKPLYVNYTQKLQYKYIWESPIFGNQSVKYGAVHTLKEHYSTNDTIHINIDGIAIDERTIEEIISGYNFPKSKLETTDSEPVESQLNIDYQLYAEDRSIFSVIGKFDTKIDEKTNQTIQLELYHLPENSSFRPQIDAAQKEGQRIFDSYQKMTESDNYKNNDKYDYFYDLNKELKNNPPKSIPEKINIEERIELFVEEIIPEKKVSFWTKIKSLFK